MPIPHPEVESEVFQADAFEVVLYDTRIGRTIRLNPAASAIWYLCDAVNTDADIADALVDVFGLERDEAVDSVRTALAEFASARLLSDGSESAKTANAGPNSFLPRIPDPCGAPTGDLGWVRSLELGVGGWRVGVRASSNDIAEAISSRFSALVVPSSGWARTNFSIRRVGSLIRTYEVLNAGVRVARSRTLNSALEVLDDLLGGVALFGHEPPGLVSMEIGLIVRGGMAVLVDVEGLKCTDRRWALDLLDGARATWRVLVDPTTMTVCVPGPALRSLSGASSWERYPLVGILLSGGTGRDPETLRRVYRLAESAQVAWLGALQRLEGRVIIYDDLESARPAVAGLIAGGASSGALSAVAAE